MVLTSNSKKRKKPSIANKRQKNLVTYVQYKAVRDTDLTNSLPGIPRVPIHIPTPKDPPEDPVHLDAVHEEIVLHAAPEDHVVCPQATVPQVVHAVICPQAAVPQVVPVVRGRAVVPEDLVALAAPAVPQVVIVVQDCGVVSGENSSTS